MKALRNMTLGLVLGLSIGLVHTADAVEAKPKDKAPEWGQTETTCRGNGAGGYRRCRVDVRGRVDKVVYDLWINGEYHVGFTYSPFDPDDVVVSRNTDQ